MSPIGSGLAVEGCRAGAGEGGDGTGSRALDAPVISDDSSPIVRTNPRRIAHIPVEQPTSAQSIYQSLTQKIRASRAKEKAGDFSPAFSVSL
jgi:hypothetical protein